MAAVLDASEHGGGRDEPDRIASMRRLLPVVPACSPASTHGSHPRFCTCAWYSTGKPESFTASSRNALPVVPMIVVDVGSHPRFCT
jgi:hypothetical protein